MEVERLNAELLEVDSELASVQSELDHLLHRQEELQERRSLLTAQLESIQSVQQQEEETRLQAIDWEHGVFPWAEKVQSTLKSFFKLDSFRHLQLSSINATLSNRNSILIMPTGGGKSLCYQLPACLNNGLTLVVSPLVSLMQDQLLAVQSLHIESSMLNASTSREEATRVHRAVSTKGSSLKLLYVTPERIAKSKRIMSSLEKAYKLKQLSLIVIDEVHCASQWGHDFRPDYKKLGVLKTQFPDCPILGLTATATSKVLADVKEMLSLSQCLIFRASYNRPNLFYGVRSKSTSHKAQVEEIAQLIRTKYPKDCGIVYCFSRKDCEEVTFDLSRLGVKAACYHADLPGEERTRVHMDWLKGSKKVIVATIAFGMGIDKPDVRFVIHHSISKSMENYYQESGRAGRDGQPADCIIFFRAADVFRQSTMVFTEHTGLQNLYAMVRYCLNQGACRRSIIARSFGEKWTQDDCTAGCDICTQTAPSPAGPSTSSCTQSEMPEATAIDDITSHCKALIDLIEHAQKKDKRLTSQMLVDSWRGQGPHKLAHVSAPKISVPDCEGIILRGILEGVLKEEFHFTPYNTISYIGLGRKAGLVKRGVVQVTQTIRSSSVAPPSKSDTQTASREKEVGKQDKSVKAGKVKKRKLPAMYLSDSDSEDFVQVKRKRNTSTADSSCSTSTVHVIEIDSD